MGATSDATKSSQKPYHSLRYALLILIGSIIGGLLSQPILNLAAQHIFSAGVQPVPNTEPKWLIGYYNSIIFILLSFLPLILFVTYFVVRGQSQQKAREIAESEVRSFRDEVLPDVRERLSEREERMREEIDRRLSQAETATEQNLVNYINQQMERERANNTQKFLDQLGTIRPLLKDVMYREIEAYMEETEALNSRRQKPASREDAAGSAYSTVSPAGD